MSELKYRPWKEGLADPRRTLERGGRGLWCTTCDIETSYAEFTVQIKSSIVHFVLSS